MIINLLKRLAYFFIRIRLTSKYNEITLKSGSKIDIKTYFEGKNAIGINTRFSGSIGRCSYIGANCNINGHIGRYSCIGAEVSTIIGVHPLNPFVSINPMFYSIQKQNGYTYVKSNRFEETKYIDGKNYSVEIGNDVWIGSKVVLMGGIKIGDGAVIATGAVVTHDVEPYQIVGGVPAKHIKMRFRQEQVEYLLNNRWWEKDEQWLRDHVDLFQDINVFIREAKEEDL